MQGSAGHSRAGQSRAAQGVHLLPRLVVQSLHTGPLLLRQAMLLLLNVRVATPAQLSLTAGLDTPPLPYANSSPMPCHNLLKVLTGSVSHRALQLVLEALSIMEGPSDGGQLLNPRWACLMSALQRGMIPSTLERKSTETIHLLALIQ